MYSPPLFFRLCHLALACVHYRSAASLLPVLVQKNQEEFNGRLARLQTHLKVVDL
jgi:hypothetical protein